jgi:hypothetical protein
MVRVLTSTSHINQSGTLRAMMSGLLIILLVFLPLSSWANSIISPVNKVSDGMSVMDMSGSQDNIKPCHSSDTEMTNSDQDVANSDCCGPSGLHTECDNCEQNCAFVKHFSYFIESFTQHYHSTQLALPPIAFIETQFPVPPFRPPAS